MVDSSQKDRPETDDELGIALPIKDADPTKRAKRHKREVDPEPVCDVPSLVLTRRPVPDCAPKPTGRRTHVRPGMMTRSLDAFNGPSQPLALSFTRCPSPAIGPLPAPAGYCGSLFANDAASDDMELPLPPPKRGRLQRCSPLPLSGSQRKVPPSPIMDVAAGFKPQSPPSSHGIPPGRPPKPRLVG